MNKLITIGCSYTFGHGLADCIHSDGVHPLDEPSKLGFAQIVATHLRRKLVNLSVPGAGDKHIMHIADNTNFDLSDICVIQWSHNDRHCIIKQHTNVQIGTWKYDKPSKPYYKFLHNDWDSTIMRCVYINYINLKLRSLGIKTYNILPVDAHPKTLNIDRSITMSDKNLQSFKVDRALDNSHPGPKSQKLFAEYLINKYFA